jgi:hypothetical protein
MAINGCHCELWSGVNGYDGSEANSLYMSCVFYFCFQNKFQFTSIFRHNPNTLFLILDVYDCIIQPTRMARLFAGSVEPRNDIGSLDGF